MISDTSSQVLIKSKDERSTGATQIGNKVKGEDSNARVLERLAVGRGVCRKGSLRRGLKYTGGRY